MTQLIIAGTEAVLPLSFSVTVRRENPFFTKSGEYTYDVQLRLDNAVNLQLYGFLNRLNRQEQLYTGRTVTLMADGHVYLRGTEVITRWTHESVTIQIVSGESELNWLVGQEQKVSSLQLPVCDLGWVNALNALTDEQDVGYHHDLGWPRFNCCYPMIRDEGAGVTYNETLQQSQSSQDGLGGDSATIIALPRLDTRYTQLRPQPFLCALVRGIIEALDYTIGTDELATHDTFKRAFLVNTVDAQGMEETLPAGWSVKEFLEEVEKLTGCVILVGPSDDPEKKGRVDILMKTTFFLNAEQYAVANVVDSYEAEVQQDEDADQSTATLQWRLPDTRTARLACLPKGLSRSAQMVTCTSLQDVETELTDGDSRRIAIDTSTSRRWILDRHAFTAERGEETRQLEKVALRQVDYLSPLEREGAPATIEMDIVPALMDWHWYNYTRLGTTIVPHAIKTIIVSGSGSTPPAAADDEQETLPSFGDVIRASSEPAEEERQQLYIALFNGLQEQEGTHALLPEPYIDFYQATCEPGFRAKQPRYTASEGFVGSLLLRELDESTYNANGAYQIDTRTAVTFETFDPNTIDTRQVYVIGGRRYVVRDVEETIGSEGRQPMWRVTCHPINITDETLEHRWVLTRGVWDDGAAWLDDGRWNDNPT